MKAIKFSEIELEYLRAHYQAEIEDTERYLFQLKEILSKLRVSKRTVIEIPFEKFEKEVKVGKKRGRKPGKKIVADKPAKKRGRPKSSTKLKPEPKKALEKDAKPKTKPSQPIKKKVEAKPKTDKKVALKKPEMPIIKPEPKKEVKKRIKKKVKRANSKGKLFLKPLSKPLKKKEVPVVGRPPVELPPVVSQLPGEVQE